MKKKVLRSNIGGTIIDTPILNEEDEEAAKIALAVTNSISDAFAEIVEVEE